MKGQWGKVIGYIIGTAIVTTAITLGPPMIGSGTGWLPDSIARETGDIDLLFWGMTWMSIAIFAMVGGVIIYSMVHFRARPGDTSDGEHLHGSARLEVVWIVLPTVIVMTIAVLSWMVIKDAEIGLYDEAKAKSKGAASMVVEVRGFSFGWAFRYKDTDGKHLFAGESPEPSAELVLPVDEVVKFEVMSCSGKERLGRTWRQSERDEAARLSGRHHSPVPAIEAGLCERYWDATTKDDVAKTKADAVRYVNVKRALQQGKKVSKDDKAFWDTLPRFRGDEQFIEVNHSFWVPEARLKIDAVSGLRTYVQWTPSRVTTPSDRFQVVCAELCGSGHNGMRTDMCVVDQATFDWWAKLEPDERSKANCVNLRLMTCLGKNVGDRTEAIAKMATLSEKDPEASCKDVEEQAA